MPTPPLVRVVLLHKRAGVQSFMSATVNEFEETQIFEDNLVLKFMKKGNLSKRFNRADYYKDQCDLQ